MDSDFHCFSNPGLTVNLRHWLDTDCYELNLPNLLVFSRENEIQTSFQTPNCRNHFKTDVYLSGWSRTVEHSE